MVSNKYLQTSNLRQVFLKKLSNQVNPFMTEAVII